MSIAQQELDYTTLKWVKDEIQESLNQTRQALEAYVENPNDTTQIRFCATYLHQIYGTLQMVEIYGGALLAEEMELLANAISQGKVSRKEDAYEVLMRAILQLPAYLEHLENGQQDMPVILLPLLNDLRTARGEHLLSENAFFSPNLSVSPPEDSKKPGKEPVNAQQYAKKLRPVYQAALVRWYRNINTSEALKKMAIVIRELLHSSTTENATRLWWVASGIVEGLLDGGLEASNSVKQLMGHQIDRQIKRVIDQGEQSFSENPPVELLKNLLYYVATSTSQGTRTGQIKIAFNLEQLLPGSVDVNEAFAQLRGSKTDLMQSVSAVIKEDLLHVKDQLDIFVRTKDKPVSDLEPLNTHLNRISDTLAMLGLGDLHKIIQDQNRSITEIVQSGMQPSELSLMEVASALLYVESSLEGLQSSANSSALSSQEKVDTLLPPSEQRQLNNLVIGEATKLVTEVKEAFNAYATDTANRAAIETTPGKLDEIRGVLAILDLRRAANLLNTAIDYIRHQLLRDDIEPNQKALDLLADVITSIEYFLEAVAENRGHPENILRVAEASAQELGYTTESINNIFSSPAAPEVEPTAVIELEEEPSLISEQTSPGQAAVEPVAAPEKRTVEATTPEAAKPAVTAATATKLPEDDIDEEILEIFLEEADEVVGTMQENLRAWKQNRSDSEALTVLRRSYHTIKGSGRLAGAKVVGEFAWSIENLLNRVIDGRLEMQPAIFDLLENAETTLQSCIQHLKGELDIQPNVRPIVDLAEAFADGSYSGGTLPKPDLIDELLGDITKPVSPEPLALETGTPMELETTVEETPTQKISLGTAEPAAKEPPASAADSTGSQNLTLLDIFKKETSIHLATINKYLIPKVPVRYVPTAALANGTGPGVGPRAVTALVAGKMFPNQDAQVTAAAAEQIGKALPGTQRLTSAPAGPSSLFAVNCDRLIVLSELDQSGRTPYGWSPMQLDQGKRGADLESWLALPWQGPAQIVLPGFHTAAETGLKGGANGSDIFLPVCGLMASGADSILLSRWPVGGQSTFDLIREYAQELPYASASESWRRSVLLGARNPIDVALEPRIRSEGLMDEIRGTHPFFWAGYLLVDTGAKPAAAAAP